MAGNDQNAADQHDVEARVIRSVARVLMLDEREVTSGSLIIDDLAADSLDVIDIVIALEEEFGIEILDEEAESAVTVGDVIVLVRESLR